MAPLTARRSRPHGGAQAAPTAPDAVAARGARRVRRLWDRRVQAWEHHAAVGLERVVDALVAEAGPAEGKKVVDLGCGTGQLSIPIARGGAKVTAVDISPKMIEALDAKASELGLQIETTALPVQELTMDAGSVDLVVSNYTMHHLYDEEKRAVLAAAFTWLRPGGRLVLGDMMFGRGGTREDRQIIGSKVRVMLGRGPAGWWRIAKNVVRFSLRMRERPLPMEAWLQMLGASGFVEVRGIRVVAEAAVVVGTKPDPSRRRAPRGDLDRPLVVNPSGE